MKIVVIGDIHGRDTWKIVNDNKDADKIVILETIWICLL